MLRLKSNIIFTRDDQITYDFDYLVDCQIESDWDNYVSVCKLKVPNRFKQNNKTVIAEFRKGDKVFVNLGYVPNLYTEFVGYVNEIKQGDVVELTCEDSSYLLKRRTIRNYSSSGLTIEELIKDIWDELGFDFDYEIDDPNTYIGSIRIKQGNAMQLFDTLKKNFRYKIFFQGEILYIVRPYNLTQTQAQREAITKRFSFQQNIIQSNLTYQNSVDNDIVLKGTVNITGTNTKIERWAYYDNKGEIQTSNVAIIGNQRTKIYPDGYTAKQLETEMKKDLPDYSYSGYKGDFLTFLEPSVKPRMFATIYDDKYPEREGTYIIKSVKKSFGVNGGRQQIELNKKS